MPTARSPLLERADRAACYFSWARKAGERGGGGRWVSVIRVHEQVHIFDHETEAQAHAYIGLAGGSHDPAFRPPYGQTNAQVAIG